MKAFDLTDQLETSSSHPASPATHHVTFASCVVSAIQLAVMGGTFLGLVESLGAAILTRRHLADSGWPTGLILAAIGKATVTHVLTWVIVLIIAAVGLWGIARRRLAGSPFPVLAVVFGVLVGVIVVPTDLRLASRDTWPTLAVCWGVLAVLIVAGYRVLRSCYHRGNGRGIRRTIRVLTGAAVLVVAVSGIAFARSALLNPATYRSPPSSAVHGAKGGRPNVLWIVMDTVRADHLSCYGYGKPTTPFLEQFATHSLVFERAMSSGIWTVPSHASMFTGKNTRQHGMDLKNLWLDDEHQTIAEVLYDSGYSTASFSNNPWVSPFSNMTQGFDQTVNLHYLPKLTRNSIEYLLERWGVRPFLSWFDNDYGAAITNQLVGAWLDAQSQSDEPFLLYINYMDAHLPYRVPEQYRRMFMNDEQVARSYQLRWRAYGHITRVMSEQFNVEGPDFLTPKDIDVLTSQYDACIRYVDDRIAEMIRMFEERDLIDNTIVIVASDHGEYLNTHGLWGHRYLAFDDVARVALLIKDVGRERSARIGTPVSLADLFAVVKRVTQAEGAATEGDLLAHFSADEPDAMVITEYGGPTPTTLAHIRGVGVKTGDHRDSPQIAVTGARFKYIASADQTRELYDLVADPSERDNLIHSHEDVARRFAEHLDAWLTHTPQYVPKNPLADRNMDQEIIDSLRDIGYAGDSD